MAYRESYLRIAKVQAVGAKKVAEEVLAILGGYREPEMDADAFGEAAATLQAAADMLKLASETTRKHQAIIEAEDEAEAARDAAEASNA